MESNDDRDRRWKQMQAIQQRRAIGKKAHFQRSKIDRFRAELEDFARQGISLAAMADWLATHKRTKVHPSTISKRLVKWQQG